MPEHGQWLTYAELAERFGVSRDAAKMLARRKGWLRKPANSRGGVVRVMVPYDPEHQNAHNEVNVPVKVPGDHSSVPEFVPAFNEPVVPLGKVLTMVSDAVAQERADRDRQLDQLRNESARRLAEVQTMHLDLVNRLQAQGALERSLWLERVDAAEIRAERVEQRLDQVLDQLLANQVEQGDRLPWWRRWFGSSIKSDLGR